jgi:NADH-quinone oxidoreductase subunit K
MDARLFLGLSAILFAIGVATVLLRRGAIVILMGIELMLNAANLTFITFARQHQTPEAQIYVFFVMTLAAAEAAVGLAIILTVFKNRQTLNIDEVDSMKD